MLTSILTSIVAYISTNIDDIFVLMILLAQASEKNRMIAGHFLGVGMLTAISMIGALGLQNLPLKYTGILGLVPIGLGIRAWLDRSDEGVEAKSVGVFSMAAITLGNGADNVGVYLPLFTGFSGGERIGAMVIFAVMTALWLWLSNSLAEFPNIRDIIKKYKAIAIPVVFITLGVFIILDSGLIG